MLRSLLGLLGVLSLSTPVLELRMRRLGASALDSRRRRTRSCRFEGEERLVVGRHSTFLSREEHWATAGALFYKVEGEKHCVMRKAMLGN